MDCRVVQRIGGRGDPQEARALLVGLGSQPLDIEQVSARGETAVGGAVLHDVARQRRADARHVLQQIYACGIKVDAHRVDAALHGIVQLFLEQRLVHIVLVLPHPDRLGVYLDQFREGVEQPAADGYRAAHRDVVVGKLLARHLGGGIDRRPVFAHRIDLDALRQRQAGYEALRLAASGAVADGDDLYIVFLYHVAYLLHGRYALVHGGMRIDGVVVQQVTLGIQADHLAAGAEAGVDGHRPLLAHRRCQQQLAQILAEDTDGTDVGLLLGNPEHLVLYRGVQETLEAVGHGVAQYVVQLARCHPLSAQDYAGDAFEVALVVGLDLDRQHPFGGAAQDGQQAVRGHLCEGFAMVEPAAVVVALLGFLSPLARLSGDQHTPLEIAGPEHAAHLAILADALCDDVARPLYGGLTVGHILIDIFACGVAGRGNLEREEGIGEGLQATFPGHRGAGALLGAVRQVKVLQCGRVDLLFYLHAQLGRQSPLLFYRLEHRRLALVKVGKVLEIVLDLPHLHLVQAAGTLLAVAAYEGDSRPLLYQFDAVQRLPLIDANLGADMFYV